MKICTLCEKKFDDSWEICLHCSTKLQFREGAPPHEPPRPTDWKKELQILFITTGSLALLFWGLCGPPGLCYKMLNIH